MVFSSLTFLFLFLPLNIILYYAIRGIAFRNLLLTVFSLFFYAWGEPLYVFLLIGTTLIDYLIVLNIERNKGTIFAKFLLTASISINLGFLFLFKYLNFFIDNLNLAFRSNIDHIDIIMPIGISFYTFQALSYIIDVYKGVVPAQKKYLNFLLFISLFHQLVAGPIVRYSEIAQDIEKRTVNFLEFSTGIYRFCFGLFKKVAIANIAAELAIPYLSDDISNLSRAESWYGIFLFSIQIFFDFSGYSDMAIGLGKMFGFHYAENFNSPYAATSITDFWRRWHISLSSFFKDYLYIPLGGNKSLYFRNLFIVWFLTGIWHGASWNFILWGLYFGVIIALEKVIISKLLNKTYLFIRHSYALFLIAVGWVLFQFTSLDTMMKYLGRMFWEPNVVLYNDAIIGNIAKNIYWILFAIMLCFPIFDPANETGKQFIRKIMPFKWMQISLGLFMLIVSTSLLVGKSYNPFIYFRF